MSAFEKIESLDKIYSGVLFKNGKHVTYHYNPGGKVSLPKNVKEGDDAMVVATGIAFDLGRNLATLKCHIHIITDPNDDIDGITVLKHQMGKNPFAAKVPLHITLHTSIGFAPRLCGELLSKIEKMEKSVRDHVYSELWPFQYFEGKWGFLYKQDQYVKDHV